MESIIKEIEKIKIEPDECLFVKFKEDVPLEEMKNTISFLEKHLPAIKILGYPENCFEFKVVKKI